MNKKIITIFLIAFVLIMLMIPTCFALGLGIENSPELINEPLVDSGARITGVISTLFIIITIFIQLIITFF